MFTGRRRPGDTRARVFLRFPPRARALFIRFVSARRPGGRPLAGREKAARPLRGPSIGCRPRDGCQPTWSPRLSRALAAAAAAAHARAPPVSSCSPRLNNTTRVRRVCCQLRAFCDRFFFLLPTVRARLSVALSFHTRARTKNNINKYLIQ